MNKKQAKINILLFLVLFFSVTAIRAVQNENLGSDSTNDVEKIKYSFPDYDYEKGDFKDEIDIVSLSVTEDSENITMTLTCEDAPVIDGYHLYWVWISFTGEGTSGTDAGAWFWTGGYESTNVGANWWVWKDTTDFTSLGTGSDKPIINEISNSLSWETNASYWDDLSNHATWTASAWAWTSDNTTYAQSLTGGFSYWDYYPNDDSVWNEDTDETSDTNGEPAFEAAPTPGLELTLSIISLPLVALIYRRRKK